MTEAERERAGIMDLLSDPVAVHLNMLRGGIAKPSPANIWHLYGRALLDAMPSEFRAHLSGAGDGGDAAP